MVIFNRQGERTGTLTADEGSVIEPKKSLKAHGNVIVRSETGLVLYADTLYYDPARDRVLSDGFVTMVSQQDSLSGYGFSAAPDLSDWEIRSPSGATRRRMEEK